MPKTPRFFINIDGSELMVVSPPLTLEQFMYDIVGITSGTQVDGFIHHMFTVGDCAPLFKSDLADAEPVLPDKWASCHIWRQMHNRAALLAMPEDPWDAVIAKAHEQGKPFWACMRFNDAHPPEYGPRSRFGIANPDCFVGADCPAVIHAPGPDGKVGPCRHLNFALPQVRQHRKDLIAELCRRYDIDGFEWDLTRDSGHNFKKADAHRAADITSNYMRDFRALLDEIGEERGRPLGFGARVPGTLEACEQAGLDVETWIREGIVSMLTPTVYYDTSCELPFDTFVKLAKGTSTLIYANVTEGVGPGRFRPPPLSAVRAAILNAWRGGVDGINLFNFHHHLVDNVRDCLTLLSECGDPATLEGKDKLYMIAGIGVPSQSRFFQMPYESWHPHQLPVELGVEPDGPGVTIRVPIGDDIDAARRDRLLASAILRLDLVNLTSHEKLALRVNGREVPISAARWEVGRQYPCNWTGMHGHWEASFDLTTGDWIRQGDNNVHVVLHDRPQDIAPPLILYAVRVEINYNVLPMGLMRDPAVRRRVVPPDLFP